ncbi:kinase-like protein [Choiromyces venosus 120613-1]|uniref:Kinase-like protein n=1 Tax=Choiromyces venosus 120613-1 TaxID=1336337 RepID=A0A3N4JLB6_9PEZI|nr:kinase-like protein [Choiromyces venosus 120613-1]
MFRLPRARVNQVPTRRFPPQVHPLQLHPRATRIYCREEGTRQVWDLGNGNLYKFRPHKQGVYESDIHDLIQSTTTIPIPTIYYEWVTTEGSDRDGPGGGRVHHMIMEEIPGEALDEVWPRVNVPMKARLIRQFENYVSELRRVTNPSVCSCTGGPLANVQGILFGRGYDSRGPISDEESLWLAMTHNIRRSPSLEMQQALITLRPMMPNCFPAVLTHLDLHPGNILVRNGNIVAIIDWEHAGFYPCWMEYVMFRHMCSDPRLELENAALPCMPAYPAARVFMRILAALRSSNMRMVEWAMEELINCA